MIIDQEKKTSNGTWKIYEDHSKSSKPHPERRTIAEHSTTSYKMRTNSVFRLNFCAGEAHTKVRGVRQM